MSLDWTDVKLTLGFAAWRYQAITWRWANVDQELCLHKALLGHNELKCYK